MTEDEKVGWHHRLDGREFEQAGGESLGEVGMLLSRFTCVRLCATP